MTVVTGEASWLKLSRHVLFALAAAALLMTETSLTWKIVAMLALVLAAINVNWRQRRQARFSTLRLYSDGFATLVSPSQSELPAGWGGQVWVSSRVCVVPVTLLDTRTKTYQLVCSSHQQPADYRQLLRLLRMSAGRN